MSEGSGRHETNEALADERAITDKRTAASDDQLERWRTDHADDALNGAVELKAHRSWLGVVNMVMVVLVVLWLAVITQQVLLSTSRISDINSRQIATVQRQNDAQLCAQHDIIVSVRKIGSKLGLPVEDITVPDVTGLDCP
jgi:hypothetical protein